MFRCCFNDTNVFMEGVVGFNQEAGEWHCTQNHHQTVFLKQKVDKTIQDGNMEEYNSTYYDVCRVVKKGEGCYERIMESEYQQDGSRSLWRGQTMKMDYKTPSSIMMNFNTSLAAETSLWKLLKTLTSRLHLPVLINTSGANSTSTAHSTNSANGSTINANDSMHAECVRVGNAFTILKHDVRKAYRSVNTRKAEVQDSISSQVFRACSDWHLYTATPL